MSEDPFILEDSGCESEKKFCPIIREDCKGSECQWWVMDFMEDKGTFRVDCAVSIIAKGITDEALVKGAK